MNHREFDAMLRRRVAQEAFAVNPKVEHALKNTILHPTFPQEAKRAVRRGAALAVAASLLVCTAALALTEMTARPDATSPTPQPMAQPTAEAQRMTVTPETLAQCAEQAACIRFEVSLEDGMARYHVTASNPFDQPLLIEWGPTGDDWPQVTPTSQPVLPMDTHAPLPTGMGQATATPVVTVAPTPTPTPTPVAAVSPTPTPLQGDVARPTPLAETEARIAARTVLLMPGETLEDSFWAQAPLDGGSAGLHVTLGLARKEMYVLPSLAGRSDEDYAAEQAAMEDALNEGRVVVAAGRPALPDAYQADITGPTPLAYYATPVFFQLQEAQIPAPGAAWEWVE